MTTSALEQDQTDQPTTGEPDEATTTDPVDEPQDWYFTFGSGHRLYVGLEPAALGTGEGIDVMGYYVVIHGSYHGARAHMYQLFGAAWSSQYGELPPMEDLGVTWKLLIDIPGVNEGEAEDEDGESGL